MDYAVIVAGGRGLRMQTDLPKQFIELNGEPVLMHTVRAFSTALEKASRIILVLPADHIPYWNTICSKFKFQIPHSIVEGGRTRFESVKNGLHACDGIGVVGIHDGVRPLVSTALIQRCYSLAAQRGSALPVVRVTQSLRKKELDSSYPIDREGMLMVQTPQCFDINLIKKAYLQEYTPSFTDDATVFEGAGHEVSLVDGESTNIKITTPQDMKIAEAIIGKPERG